jgi:hypothetical protein
VLKLANQQIAERALALLGHEIPFVHNPDFKDGATASSILRNLDALAEPSALATKTDAATTSGRLSRMYEAPLLTRDREQQLFRCMNFAKHRANVLRAGLSSNRPEESTVIQIERLLDRAISLRNQIVCANTRWSRLFQGVLPAINTVSMNWSVMGVWSC